MLPGASCIPHNPFAALDRTREKGRERREEEREEREGGSAGVLSISPKIESVKDL